MSNQLLQEYDDLKKILKSSDGRELYSHLIECFNNLILYYPDDALDKFEEVSYLLKDEDKTKMRKFLNLDNKKDIKCMTECKKGYVEKATSLFPKAAAEIGDGDDPPEPSSAGFVSNLFADSEILEWAGISFGESETYRLQASLTKLSSSSGSDKIRLWGKIYGTENDYYVAEGFVAASGGDDEEGEKPKGFEDRGSGINQYVYWVTDNSLKDWTMLPDISPAQLEASRSIKVKFTGNLERDIITNPFFFGKEKHYLKAQIVRIAFSTTIMPKGLHRTTEDNPKEIEPIEFEDETKAYVPTTETQSDLGNWVHSTKSILKNNRLTHSEPEGEDNGDVEPEELQKKLDAKDPQEPRLKPLTNDISADGEDTAWTLRLLGDQTRVKGIKNKTHHYGVVTIKSHVWPGSTICWKGNKYLQIYIGDGLKSESTSYYPVYPPTIPEDPEDLTENPEPTPLEAPPVENHAEGEGEPEAPQE